MELLKVAGLLYDRLTLPVYFLCQQPWKALRDARRVQAKKKDESDPSSAWVTTDPTSMDELLDQPDLDSYFQHACKLYSDKRSLGFREVVHEEEEVQPDGKVMFRKVLMPDYKWLTYAQVNQKVDELARGFAEIGIRPKQNVIIYMETRIEWMLCMMALIRMGAVVATLYSTLGEEGIVYGANLLEAGHMIASESLLSKLKNVAPQLNYLKSIICVGGTGHSSNSYVEKLSALFEFIALEEVEARGRQIIQISHPHRPSPEDIALIMFTSGSTGQPKGVLIDHKNLMAAQRSLFTIGSPIKPILEGDETYIAYLPLAHIFELTVEFMFIAGGVAIGYSSPFTLTDKSPGIKPGCRGDAVVLRPTFMCAVPLVLDKVRKGVLDGVKIRGPGFAKMFNYAIKYKTYWRERGYNTPIVNKILFKKIQQVVGGKLKYLWCGGAALSPETNSFMLSCLDAKVCQGYGATETMGANTVTREYDLNTGRIGSPTEGCYLKLIPWSEGGYYPTDSPNPRGELVVGGDCITRGYYKNKEATEEAYYEEDGTRWFRTGDIAEVNPDGVFKIVDRRKDFVKLQFGEYISLGKVENTLKNSEFVENVCVYGDSYQNYVIAFVMPNRIALLALAKSLNRPAGTTFEDLCSDNEIVSQVENSLREAAKKGKLNKYETPQKIMLCPEEWTPDSGLLTAAMKIRRKQIYDYYSEHIKSMYALDSNCNQK